MTIKQFLLFRVRLRRAFMRVPWRMTEFSFLGELSLWGGFSARHWLTLCWINGYYCSLGDRLWTYDRCGKCTAWIVTATVCVTYITRESCGCLYGAVMMDVCLSQAMKHNTIYSPRWPSTSGKRKNGAPHSISNTFTHTHRDTHTHTHQPSRKTSFSSLSFSDISPARGPASLLPLIAFLFCSW